MIDYAIRQCLYPIQGRGSMQYHRVNSPKYNMMSALYNLISDRVWLLDNFYSLYGQQYGVDNLSTTIHLAALRLPRMLGKHWASPRKFMEKSLQRRWSRVWYFAPNRNVFEKVFQFVILTHPKGPWDTSYQCLLTQKTSYEMKGFVLGWTLRINPTKTLC